MAAVRSALAARAQNLPAPLFFQVGLQSGCAGFTATRLAQLVERKTLNLMVVGSSPTVEGILFLYAKIYQYSPFFTIK